MTKPEPEKPEAPAVEPERPMPTNVIEAIARVMSEVGGIERLSPAQRRARGMTVGNSDDSGISYAFRGVDQVTAQAQGLFGKYCVVTVPTEVLDREVETVMVRDRPWIDMIVKYRWTIYGPGGVDDFITAETEGQAREMADKASPKCLTQAYKNLILRLLCIGDPSDDSDGTTHEADPPSSQQPTGSGKRETTERDPAADPVMATFKRVSALKGSPVADAVKAWAELAKKALTAKAFHEDAEWMAEVNSFIDEQEKGAAPVADPATALGATEEPPTEPEGNIAGAAGDAGAEPPTDKPKRGKTARELAAEKNESGYDGSGGRG